MKVCPPSNNPVSLEKFWLKVMSQPPPPPTIGNALACVLSTQQLLPGDCTYKPCITSADCTARGDLCVCAGIPAQCSAVLSALTASQQCTPSSAGVSSQVVTTVTASVTTTGFDPSNPSNGSETSASVVPATVKAATSEVTSSASIAVSSAPASPASKSGTGKQMALSLISGTILALLV
ncbi:hypothetical protein BC830DRAFT_413115 [Chytriomyces sp. MP71]|nr:hypothetical protein BC830DRAFT_413115 [Chytriomyces sp. MP71]